MLHAQWVSVPPIKGSRGKFTVDFPEARLPFRTIVGLFGPSGSGKTTYAVELLNSLGPRRVTLLPQADSLLNDLTAEQNVRLLSDPGFSRKELNAKICEMADHLNIAARLSSVVNDLSGGERRRVLIMRSLLSGADMLILDEPFTGLGWCDEVRAREVVRSCRESYQLILVVSHSAELIWSLCDYIWIVNNGRRVACLSNSAPEHNLPATLSGAEADSLGVSNIIGARELAAYIEEDHRLSTLRDADAILGFWTSHAFLYNDRCAKAGALSGRLKSDSVSVSRHFLRGERLVELRLSDRNVFPPLVLRDRTSGTVNGDLWLCLDTIILIN